VSAVIDACFFINWASFSGVGLLKSLFRRLFMPEVVFSEIKSPRARSLSAEWLSERYLVLTPVTKSDEAEAAEVLSIMAHYPQLPVLDPPELYAFVLAKRLGVPLLTDNKAPKRLAEVVDRYRDVRVYDSLDVLVMAVPRDALREAVEKFIRETSFQFSRRRLEELGI